MLFLFSFSNELYLKSFEVLCFIIKIDSLKNNQIKICRQKLYINFSLLWREKWMKNNSEISNHLNYNIQRMYFKILRELNFKLSVNKK